MFNLSPSDWIAILGVYITILGAVWGLGRYIDGRFNKVFDKIESVKEQILSKLDYHEKHDDKRFSEVREDLAEIRIRNAYFDARLDQEAQKTNRHGRSKRTETAIS